jgi:hypothetical protein
MSPRLVVIIGTDFVPINIRAEAIQKFELKQKYTPYEIQTEAEAAV